MKVLIAVLTIRFLFGLLDTIGKNEVKKVDTSEGAKHPAEYELR